MSSTTAPKHRGRDLDDRFEIAEFVTRFYREIAQDERFHRYFHTLAGVDWHAHTLELTDFWAGLLLGEPHESADEVIGLFGFQWGVMVVRRFQLGRPA